MGSGFDITTRILAETRNEAAVEVLIDGLDSPCRDIQDGCLRAILERRSTAGHLELLRRWHTFSDRWRALIIERPGRIAAAARDAVVSADDTLFSNGCAVAVALHEFDLIPILIRIVESANNPHATAAAQTLLELAELLHDELSAPRDYRERRDPQLMRQHIVGSLESSIARIEQHQRPEVVESFLLLTKSDNSTLRRLLDDPRHPAHSITLDTLRSSPRPGVMRIVLKFLEKSSAPTAVLQVLAQRRDVPFLRKVAKSLGQELSESVRRNLRRVDHLGWFDDLSLLHALNEHEQQVAVHLAGACGCLRSEVFAVVRFVLREGNVGGRRAAAAALAEFRGVEANELAMATLDDPDPLVQAAIVSQLRDRGIPGAMARIIVLVDSENPDVRATAQRSLAEFSFQRYLAAFDMLDPEVRVTTGVLVRKIDPQTVSQLADELVSPSRIRRMRGLQIAPIVGAVAELEEKIIALLSDEDHFIRAEAARALGTIQSSPAQEALKSAQHDRSLAVQEAAEDALLAMLNFSKSLVLPPIDFGALSPERQRT